ncbi:hypothetical protein Micbo1qcDRAFT_192373 [Microdochium bolleyi]|uniref:Homeobox domain-containing protein n=1 Tax=Microdochium bolleyi TaxID=196109 RepID=A0A136JDU7_9PEZI|nr:hypothetical protein Micbo1qcDRAFT_192373 [Microdochium bolleyi]
MAESTLPENTELPPSSSPSSVSPDSSALSLQSSFRLESGFSGHGSDSEKHPKGKRKRTTSHDKTILEASYLANPKPDKAARLDIVRRVSLSEKEVQIWFQNRRQNDRRKSRPLSAEEIAALRYGGAVQILSADSSFMVNDTADETAVSTFDASQESISSQKQSTPVDAATPPRSPSPRPAEPICTPAQTSAPNVGTHTFEFINLPSSSQKSEPERPAHAQSFSASVGYLSNRWNMNNSFSTPLADDRHEDDEHRFDSMLSSVGSDFRNSTSSIFASQASSQFRLSLSLEGKAEVVSSQPSPPRPLAGPMLQDTTSLPPVRLNRTLHRSRSSPLGITLPPISTLTAHLPPQLSRGRSRDVSAWESCCDADDRDELTKLAESESSGSAIAAISLLRSSSSSASLSSLVQGASVPLSSSGGNGVLQSNPNKRNAPSSKTHVRSGSGHKKPKISRTTSSVARMQTLPLAHPDKENEVQVHDEVEPEKKAANKGSLSVILSPSADSDKENWSPDAEGNPMSRRRAPSSPSVASKLPPVLGSSKNVRRVGRILGEHLAPLNKRAYTAPSLGKGSQARDVVDVFEDGENAENEGRDRDDEGKEAAPRKKPNDVERFMRGGEVSPSKKGDLDCIAGLLSLSQGNWR